MLSIIIGVFELVMLGVSMNMGGGHGTAVVKSLLSKAGNALNLGGQQMDASPPQIQYSIHEDKTNEGRSITININDEDDKIVNIGIPKSATKVELKKETGIVIYLGEDKKNSKMTLMESNEIPISKEKGARVAVDQTKQTAQLPPPCFKNYVNVEEKSFWLPYAKVKQENGSPLCFSYLETGSGKQTAFELIVHFENPAEKKQIQIPIQFMPWQSKDLKSINQYCEEKENDAKICQHDEDPMVFYDDNHVAFHHGWPSDWFQGYEVTTEIKPYLKANNPCGSEDGKNNNAQCKSEKNQFTYLTYKNLDRKKDPLPWKWASSEHFVLWAKDRMYHGTDHNAPSIVLQSGNKDIQEKIEEKEIEPTQYSPKLLSIQTKEWNAGVAIDRQQHWESCNFFVQLKALWLKFSQNEHLKQKLLATGNRNIFDSMPENDKYDKYGSCKDNKHELRVDDQGLLDALKKNEGDYFVNGFSACPATNILGRALMVTRELLRLSRRDSTLRKKGVVTLQDLSTHADDLVKKFWADMQPQQRMEWMDGLHCGEKAASNDEEAIIRAALIVKNAQNAKVNCADILTTKYNLGWIHVDRFESSQPNTVK